MATGFTNRSRGKVTGSAFWLGGSAQQGPGARQSYSTAAGTGGLAVGQLGLEAFHSINASSALSIWQLTGPVIPGQLKVLDMSVSSGAFIKAQAGVSFDGSTNTVMKSTYNMRISLEGLSSARWAITGVYPDTTAGGAPVGGITLSTTT